jgi:threonyl-tRNA synthetase
MKVLQLDLESVEYESIKPESRIYEEDVDKSGRFKDVVMLLVSVERGDTTEIAAEAMKDAVAFATKQKSESILIYPFAHLSTDLESPELSLKIIKSMREYESLIKMHYAPFGWNKKLKLEIKGHPLAEQSRSYGKSVSENISKEPKRLDRKTMDRSIVRKSDWSGLPETDHRSIGEKLNLYSAQEISPGMVYWHSKGYTIYRELVKFLREKYEAYDYAEISTPSMANLALWDVSGHYGHYKENMFIVDDEGSGMGLKPMNCPSTIMIYKTKKWSYRELPFRTVIFDRLYRKELSGVLGGLTRVQEFSQDDGHIFAADEQLDAELETVIRFIKEVYSVLGFKYSPKLSTKNSQNYIGDDELWADATKRLANALEKNGMEYEVMEGDASFYGPKIDFYVIDAAGKGWQCATMQLDYQLPRRFGITYTGEDGEEHTPAMIHRAVLGSLERFIGVFVEMTQGRFPLWLSPEQIRVISISENYAEYARSVHRSLKEAHIRAVLDVSDRTLDYKIREAQMEKVPYSVIIGKREEETQSVTIRDRTGRQEKMGISELVAKLNLEISARAGGPA